MKKMTYEEWMEEGKRRFGENKETWKFKCPRCSHVQSVESIMRHNPRLTRKDVCSSVNSACEGRLTEIYGCNWSLHGFITIHQLEIQHEGELMPCFEFAEPDSQIEDKKIPSRKETRNCLFLLQEGDYLYLIAEMDEKGIEYDHDREGFIKKRDQFELLKMEKQQREELGEDFDQEHFDANFSHERLDDADLVAEGCAKIIWSPIKVFGSKMEAEAYAKNKIHSSRYQITEIRSVGILDHVLDQEFDKYVSDDYRFSEADLKTIDQFFNTVASKYNKLLEIGGVSAEENQKKQLAIQAGKDILQDFITDEILGDIQQKCSLDP